MKQAEKQSATDFINDMEKIAEKINMPENQLIQAIISGLNTNIRVFVISQGIKETLEETRKVIKLAESICKEDSNEAASAAMRRIEAKLDSLNLKNLSAPVENFEEDNHQVQERRLEGRKQSQGNQQFSSNSSLEWS